MVCGQGTLSDNVDLSGQENTLQKQPNLRHPPSYVNDALTPVTFWKSKNAVERPVYLQMDFNSTFMIYVAAVKFFFELPAAAYLAKSVDYGKSFQPLAYFATDCMKFFGLSTTAYNKKNGLTVECFLIDKQLMSAKQVNWSAFNNCLIILFAHLHNFTSSISDIHLLAETLS
ncbi:Netrin-4 [Exaiptasia diaphana]|nr:Netrin-4 [Exaiptasia diaphana]